MEQTVMMMQIMLDNTRQMRKDFEELKKIQRTQAKQVTLLQVAVGRISGEKRMSTDSQVSLEATSSACNVDDNDFQAGQSANTGPTQGTFDKFTEGPSNAVGSIRWIRSTYGIDNAREIVRGLRKLNVPIPE